MATYVRTMQPRISSATKPKGADYDPSDTEMEWQKSPWNETDEISVEINPTGLNVIQGQGRNKNTCSRFNQRNGGKAEFEGGSSIPLGASKNSPVKRRQSMGAYARDDAEVQSPGVRNRHQSTNKSVSPFSKSEQRRYVSSHKSEMEDGSNRKLRQAHKDFNGNKTNETSRCSKSWRSVSAPRQSISERDAIKNSFRMEREGYRERSPQITSGEINEMLANVKMAKAPAHLAPNFDSMDSIATGHDIFFSTEYGALAKYKNGFKENGGNETKFNQKPPPEFITNTSPGPHQRDQLNSLFSQEIREVSMLASSVSMHTSVLNSKFSSRRQSSTLSDFSGRTNGTARKFTTNIRKSQTDAWFACINRGTCRSTKSPEKERRNYEASVIEKAFVVESLRQFWADKHRPGSSSGFACHKQQALLLKHLASDEIPHILFKGPAGSGKKTLAMALLREVYGEPVRNISHDLRRFRIQDKTPVEVAVPISSSPHHVELNVSSEPNATYALMALVKQICTDYAVIREISNINAKAEYKGLVLYDVDKAPDNVQHLIKWIMDCYSDACKLILCCEDDTDMLESVKSRCKVIKVEAPDTHEIKEVLLQIARKEDIKLSITFAVRIANKSKQNLRRAIMALEACKANNYPFAEDQPIPVGWEEAVVEIATGILADPSTKRLMLVRGKLQTLLGDYVHPRLILQKLVEQFLKGVESSSRRELYYWHAYYEKRLPPGTSALLKLEEFTAKFMSIHRRNFGIHQA